MKRRVYLYGFDERLFTALKSQEIEILRSFDTRSWSGASTVPLVDTLKIEQLKLPEFSQIELNQLLDAQQETLNKHLLKFIENYSRCSTSGNGSIRRPLEPNYLSFDEVREAFVKTFRFMYRLFLIDKPDHVLFARTPHLGVDNMLQWVAENLSIQTKVFYQSAFPDIFFCSDRADELFLERQAKSTNNIAIQAVDLNLFYMKEEPQRKARKNTSLSIRGAAKKSYRILRRMSQQRIQMEIHKGQSTILPLLNRIVRSTEDETAKDKIRAASQRRFLRASQKFLKDRFSELSKEKYIYFPLHLQPEMTTSEFGAEYVDQLLAIERLTAALPEGWYIYVKENPKQTYYYRSKSFFDRMAALRNVRYLPKNVSSKDLIRGAVLTATITGTAGYESLLEGKPCLYFGNAWYRNLPGAFEFQTSIDLEKVSKTKISRDFLIESLNSLLGGAHRGVVYTPYLRISEMSHADAFEVTAQSIKAILEREIADHNFVVERCEA